MAKKLSADWVYEFTGEFIPSILAEMSPDDKERFKYLRWSGSLPPYRLGYIVGYQLLMDICDKDGWLWCGGSESRFYFHNSVIGRRVKKIA